MDLQYKGLLQRCFLCVSPVNHTVIHIVRPLIETRMYLCLLCTKLERETCPDDKRNEWACARQVIKLAPPIKDTSLN